MGIVFLIRRRRNNLSKFFELFERESKIAIKDIKRKTSSSTFYKIILKEIFDINKALREIDPGFEFIRPEFKQETAEGPVFQALGKADNVSITHNDKFFFLKID
jgi:hypothetical protein